MTASATCGRPVPHSGLIILATGYTPNLHYLSEIGALTTTGQPLHKQGLSTIHTGLEYVGVEWQRSLSSAPPPPALHHRA